MIGVLGCVVSGIALTSFGLSAKVNNKAVDMEEQIKNIESTITLFEKKRYDLIINLADLVKSYNSHERGTLVDVVKARHSNTTASVDEARMIVNSVAEKYPELKSMENYRYLRDELNKIEEDIIQYRMIYNDKIKKYNKYTRSFPIGLGLIITGYKKADLNYLQFKGLQDSPKNIF